jgi:hypothetical protein
MSWGDEKKSSESGLGRGGVRGGKEAREGQKMRFLPRLAPTLKSGANTCSNIFPVCRKVSGSVT